MTLNHYIFKQVLGMTFVVALILCVTVTLLQSVRLIDLIVQKGIGLDDFILLTGLMVPRLLAFILPLTIFIAVIACYRRLSADSELTVMRATGISDFKLQLPGLLAGLVVMMVCYGLNLYISPVAQSLLLDKLFQHQSKWSIALIKEGKFTNIGKQMTLYVQSREGNNLIGIMVDNRSNEETPYTIFARYGQIIEDNGIPKVEIRDGSRQTLEDGVLHFASFDQTLIEIGDGGALNRTTRRSPEERFIQDIFNPSEKDLKNPDFILELNAFGHRVLSHPLMCLALAIAVFACLFNVPFSRYTTIQPVLITSLVGGGLLVTHIAAGIIAAKQPWLNYVQYGLPIATIFIGGYFATHLKAWSGKLQKTERSKQSESEQFGWQQV